jgi:hypothetical protein
MSVYTTNDYYDLGSIYIYTYNHMSVYYLGSKWFRSTRHSCTYINKHLLNVRIGQEADSVHAYRYIYIYSCIWGSGGSGISACIITWVQGDLDPLDTRGRTGSRINISYIHFHIFIYKHVYTYVYIYIYIYKHMCIYTLMGGEAQG